MPKAPLRSELEIALNELVAYEEGMRFQGLAVVLAKRRWPELVANERKKDLGLDAYVTREQAADHIGRALACSTTGTYDKLEADAKKVSEKMPGQFQHFIFSTSAKVGVAAKLEWETKVREAFGYVLHVVSREDILTDLTDPDNIALCRTFLRMDIDIEPSISGIVARVRKAASEETGTWLRRLADRPLIELHANRVDSEGSDGGVWGLSDIRDAITTSHRIVLEGPAGCGKTTTLFQVARSLSADSGIVLFIDLPLWVKSGRDFLAFVVGAPAFQREEITTHQLAQVESAVGFRLLLNGWNEVSDAAFEDARLRLTEIERQFPTAGILVATRPHPVAPPLPGATKLRLLPIGRRARTAYVRARLGEDGPAVLEAIMSDPALNDLTLRPFVLSQIISTAASGQTIPKTQVAVMEAAIRRQELAEEHAGPLQSPPLRGTATPFLEGLAFRMVSEGTVQLGAHKAGAAVRAIAFDLAAEGYSSTAAPHDVLNALSAHHVLERFEYPEPGFRFVHQLFQEYYAFRVVRKRYESIKRSGVSSDADRAAFIQTFLNEPAWTEVIIMLAESVKEVA
jgi:hypothetical protein